MKSVRVLGPGGQERRVQVLSWRSAEGVGKSLIDVRWGALDGVTTYSVSHGRCVESPDWRLHPDDQDALIEERWNDGIKIKKTPRSTGRKLEKRAPKQASAQQRTINMWGDK